MYQFVHWKMYNYDNLKIKEAIDKKYDSRNECVKRYSRFIIMVDTETSKSEKDSFEWEIKGKKRIRKWKSNKNYVVAFTVSIRYKHENICTLYGNRPDECVECIDMINRSICGDYAYYFIFNLPFDYIFLRKFMFRKWDKPVKQLNIDPYYPISIEFSNGIIFRDALVLAQRKLDKWASDLGVEHKKASGKWDYKRIRSQDELFDMDELEYIEHDTLAGVECLDALVSEIGCRLVDIPFTATGISRREAYRIGKKNKAKLLYNKLVLSYEQYLKFEKAFHGGYTHSNRFTSGVVYSDVDCYDEASAYPFAAFDRYPMTKFVNLNGYFTIDEILDTHDKYAYLMKATFVNVHLKDNNIQMPVLQKSKNLAHCKSTSMQIDNGRVLSAELYEAYITDIDLELIDSQYTASYIILSEVMRSEYDYLPKWFRDHVYNLYRDKCLLKGGDPVKYDLTKMKLNSVAYGMIAMKNIKEEIIEDYDTGSYDWSHEESPEAIYQKFITNRKNIYPYQWSLWITSYAQRNLHRIGACCKTWLYSDTDSCFSFDWDLDKLNAYNENVTKLLSEQGYDPIVVGDKTFYLGRAELDKHCDKFKALHSKCYAYESHGEILITVAGVPKSEGKKCLKDLSDFEESFCFEGTATNKKTHVYHFVDDIYEENGIIYGDSVDLIPCDYTIKGVTIDNIIDHYDDIPLIVDQMFTKHILSRMRC